MINNLCVSVCGQATRDVSNPSRILGGEWAKAGEIPWQLSVEGHLKAGASLIGDRWALTAAHVVHKNPNVVLRGGLVNLAPTRGLQLEQNKIIIHPGFHGNVSNRNRDNFDNDIALIRLASRAPLGPHLRPICLPETQGAGLAVGLLGSVSGWGMTENKAFSQILRYTYISVYPPDTCMETPMLGGRPMLYTGNMFCAGGEGRDSCSRDSGSPFVVPRLGEGNTVGRGPYRVEGIVSWGPDCRDRQPDFRVRKGYYTMVGNYVDWIRKTMEQVENEERK